MITFNDLPMVVAQLRNEVMSLKSLLTEQHSVNNVKAVDTHVPMSVDDAAEYLGIPKGTLYMKLSEGSILPPSQANATASIEMNWTNGWRLHARILSHCPMRN